jgi:hypothetical protein
VTLLLVGCVTAFRLCVLAFLSPYGLIEDEAHYWEWSRHLDWSYYSKGPGVAWIIAATTSVLGDTELGVRLGAPLFSAIATLAVAGLAADATGSPRARPYAAVCFMAAPFILGASMFLTIDMPFIAFWALAAWAGWHALRRDVWSAWLLLGLMIGLGFLVKYTMLLIIPGLAAFALLQRRPRRRLWPLAMGVGVLVVCALPVVVWNNRHDWPTVRHLLGHLGVAGGDQPPPPNEAYSPLWTLEYLALQLAIAGPALVVSIVVAWRMLRDRARRARSPGIVYLVCCAVPVLLFYLGVSFLTRVEANWSVAAHATLLGVAGYGIAKGHRAFRIRGRVRPDHGLRMLWHSTVVIGLVGTVGLAVPSWLVRLPLVGGMIPEGRYGAGRIMARHAERLVHDLRRETGLEPMVITSHYGLAGVLAFYMDGHPTVSCASAHLGGRKTQYDYWPETDLSDLRGRRARPAVLIGGPDADWGRAFDRVGESIHLVGDPETNRTAVLAYGFKGFGPSRDERP